MLIKHCRKLNYNGPRGLLALDTQLHGMRMTLKGQNKPDWDAVELCKILWVVSDWLSINYSLFKGYWAASDRKFATAKKLVCQCLDMCDTITSREFFCKTWKYMDAYWYSLSYPLTLLMNIPCDSKGLNPQQTAFATSCTATLGLPSDIMVLMAAQEASSKAQMAVWAPPLSPRTSTRQ